MKIILLKRIRGLGNVGEIVSVKDGYGRNYLIPKGIAVRATQENEERVLAQKAQLEVQNAEALKTAAAVGKKIDGKDITFIKQCGDDGRLYGSVSAKDIADEASKISGINITHSHVFLSNPIKSLGIYEVEVELHADLVCNIIINVARSESEAKDAINEYKSGKNQEVVTSEEGSAA